MEKNNNKLVLDSRLTYFIGYYVQDFKKPQIITNADGTVTEIDLHRVNLVFLNNCNSDKWNVSSFGGSGCFETTVQLDSICYCFGKEPTQFNMKSELDSLLYHPVRLDFSLNRKGKATLRGIFPLD